MRFFLIDPADLDDFSGNDTVNTVLVNSAAYRVSFADVITAGFSEDAGGEVQLINDQGLSSNSNSIGFYPGTSSDATGDVVINYLNPGYDELAPGQHGFWLLVHELGHAVGGFYDVSETARSGTYLDNQKYTMMSYNPYGQLITVGSMVIGSAIYASGLQLLDIAALQETYGTTNTDTRSDSTTYALGEGLGFYGASASDPFLYTIWDGGYANTIDASGFSSLDFGAEIDLREGHFSSIGADGNGSAWKWDQFAIPGVDPDPGNVAIAYGTVIETAVGTDHADSIIGNDTDNNLYGGYGDDIFYGSFGFDIVDGDIGTDTANYSKYDGYTEITLIDADEAYTDKYDGKRPAKPS